jgi:WD40 repeat protein
VQEDPFVRREVEPAAVKQEQETEFDEKTGEKEGDEEEEEEEEGDHLWNYRYNRRLACFSHSVTSVTFSIDGKWFVSGTASGDIKVWDTHQWAENAKLRPIRREEPRALVVSPAQRWLVVAYASVLNVFHCKPPWRLEQAIPAPVEPGSRAPSEWYCIAFSPMAEVDHPKGNTGHDYHLAAFSTHHLSVNDYSGGWGPETLGRRTRSLLQLARPTTLAYTADGWWLVCGFESGQIQLWNAFSLTLERSLNAHVGTVLCIAASPRTASYESRFVSCGLDQCLRIWHSRGWALEQICPDTRCDRNGIRKVMFSSNGHWLVSVANELVVWRVIVTVRGKMYVRIHQRLAAQCGSEGVSGAACCPTNDAIAFGSRDGVLGLWTKYPGSPLEAPPCPTKGESSSSNYGKLMRPSSNSSVEPWSMDRAFGPRTMQRITPDGPKDHTRTAKVDWFQRTHLRSLSMSTLAPRPMTGMSEYPQRGMSASASSGSIGKLNLNPPSKGGGIQGLSATIREVPTGGGNNKGGGGSGGRLGDEYDEGDHGFNPRLATTMPSDLGRWRSGGSFEFVDVLSALSGDKAAAALPGGGLPGNSSLPGGLPANVRRLGGPGSPSASPCSRSNSTQSDKDPGPCSPIRKSMLHACRNMVQRISLDPQLITHNVK